MALAKLTQAEEFEMRVVGDMQKCKHFTGIQHDVCLAGVKYDTFKGGIPCLGTRHDVPCDLFLAPTRAEAEARERETDEAIAQFKASIAASLCPQCRTKVERKRQVGRCIYAEPCGHRLGQGRLR